MSGPSGPAPRPPRAGARRAGGALQPFLVPAVVGATVLGVCVFVRMALPDALVVTLAASGLTLAVRMLDKGSDYAWAPAVGVDTDGTRRDVAHLTWSLVGRDGRVSESAVRRLRDDARRRLRRVGVLLSPDFPVKHAGRTGPGPAVSQDGAAGAAGAAGADDPGDAEARARALLGEPAWSVLAATGGRLPTLAEVEQCVEALERLTPPGTHPDGRTTS